MKNELNIYYDAEGDFLEINIGKYSEGYFRDVENGVSERIDEKTNKVVGFAVLNFLNKIKKLGKFKIISENGKFIFFYDEEGDYLEIYFGKIKKGYFKEVSDKYFERIDEKTGKVVGITIMNFKKRTEKLNELKISLPFKIEIIEN